jgi:hypothetical protein
MRRIHRAGYALVLAAAVAGADPPAPATQATGTVERADVSTRMVTLRMDDGSTLSVRVIPSEQPVVATLRPGDTVRLSYGEATAVGWKRGGVGSNAEATIYARGTMSSNARHVVTTPATVESVDLVNHQLTVRLPAGELQTINVSDLALRTDLPNLHAGDSIALTRAPGLAISIAPSPS